MLVRLAVLAVACVLSMPIGAETIRFDLNRPGSLPPGWLVVLPHPGAAPKWEVRPEASAPSKPNVLAQVSSDRSHGRFPMAILDKSAVVDGEISVKFKTMAGKGGQGAGPGWGVRGPDQN